MHSSQNHSMTSFVLPLESICLLCIYLIDKQIAQLENFTNIPHLIIHSWTCACSCATQPVSFSSFVSTDFLGLSPSWMNRWCMEVEN